MGVGAKLLTTAVKAQRRDNHSFPLTFKFYDIKKQTQLTFAFSNKVTYHHFYRSCLILRESAN